MEKEQNGRLLYGLKLEKIRLVMFTIINGQIVKLALIVVIETEY